MINTLIERRTLPTGSRPSLTVKWSRQALLSRLRQLRTGTIEIEEGPQRQRFGLPDPDGELHARIQVHDPAFYRAVVVGGTVGAGQSFIDGQWSSDDLPRLVRVLVRNRDVLDGMERGLARCVAPIKRLAYWLRRNSHRGSRRNIAAHYDLGNDFFKLFLDPTMTYSCGIFESPAATMEQASICKLERICRKLRLGPGDEVLEIGGGWGSFAIHAAGRHGCRVTTTTISRAQHDLLVRRVADAGLSDRVTALLRDYRDLQGTYDKIVSIEMIEAVGHAYYPAFFKQCSERLRPDGMALIQAITIEDRLYERARREVDFIKHFVFPGACIPSVTALSQAAALTDLRLCHLEDITPHYARTLQLWRERFHDRLPEVLKQGYPEAFTRLWDFYLCYCEGAFEERYIGNAQLLYCKPHCRQAPILPDLDTAQC